ncbi:MAG: hypothetical protein M3381_11010 [Actinomycetota bacterium]|nr:hypothetical protein [Actinomycetota bacterium]
MLVAVIKRFDNHVAGVGLICADVRDLRHSALKPRLADRLGDEAVRPAPSPGLAPVLRRDQELAVPQQLRVG